jgi:putative inorganic carbon (hco3(-)) transporter
MAHTNSLRNSGRGPIGDRVFTIPFSGVVIFTLSIISARASFLYVGVLISIVGLVLGRYRILWPKPSTYQAAFVAWAAISSLFATRPDVAYESLIDYAKLFIIFLLTANAVRTERQLRTFLSLCIVAFLAYPLRGALINYFTGQYTAFGRMVWNGPYMNPNYLALIAVLMIAACLALSLAKQQRTIVRVLLLLSAIFMLVVIFLTQSRGAFLGLTASMGLPLLALFRRSVITWVIVGGAAVVVAIVTPSATWTRFAGISKLTSTTTLAEADPEGSARERWEIQKVAWKIYVDHPIFGVGLGGYPAANAAYAPNLGRRDTHNTYLNLGAEVGTPGLVLWLSMVAATLTSARKARLARDAPIGTADTIWLERAVIALLISGLFGTWANFTVLYIFLGMVWSASRLLPSGPDSPTQTVRQGDARKNDRSLRAGSAAPRVEHRVASWMPP